jgi:hypothetical protein
MAGGADSRIRVADVIGGLRGQLGVMSFDEPTVARLCRLVTDRPVGLLAIADNQVEADYHRKGATARAWLRLCGAPPFRALRPLQDAAGGLPMVTWTVRTAGGARTCPETRRRADFRRLQPPALAMPSANTI